MATEVVKVELKNVQDASGLEAAIRAGRFTADQVVAVVGKTEGNGGVNDFTRILADQAFRRVLQQHGHRSAEEIARVPMVWSGGCDGVITPHATVFARNERGGPAGQSRLVIGAAMSAELLPEDIGRPAMVEKVAEGVRAAMRDAGLTDAADVHYVQTKTPLLTIESVADAHRRGHTVACEVHASMDVSNGTTALGIAVALGRDLDAARRADLPGLRPLLVGRLMLVRRGADAGPDRADGQPGGRGRAIPDRPRRHERRPRPRRDLRAIRNAGLTLPARPEPRTSGERVVNCFVKCEADHRGTLRGRRQIMLDDSDVHHHRHAKAAVGAVVATALGDPAVFVSVGAMHQGPHGGGPVIAIVDVGE